MKRYVALFSIILLSFHAKGQVLISLVFGDKLNSGKVEFGLDGGANFSSFGGLNSSSSTGFHLGFYFDIKLKNDWLLHTGVIVKSPLGGSGITPYSLSNPGLDSAFTGGEVERNLRYFHVPLMLKHAVYEHFYAEGGIQLGLLYKAFDVFSQNVNNPPGDLSYEISVLDKCNRIDAGLAAGIGYRLMGGNGMNLGVRYYYGLVPLFKEGSQIYNRALYLALGIPIGAGKAKEKEEKRQIEAP